MTATNHAVTGAIIGLTVTNPWLAIPLAFASHFVLDAIPHFDPPGGTDADKFGSKLFTSVMLVGGAATCLLLVLVLALGHPKHWVLAALCAFVATSPDLFWIPRYLHVRKTGTETPLRNGFLRFHKNIQWLTGSRLWPVEAIWLILTVSLLTYLW